MDLLFGRVMHAARGYLRAQVFGAYFCAQIVARKFMELGIKGSIVMTASMTSYRPNRVSTFPHRGVRVVLIDSQAAPSAPYGATKAAGE